MRVKELRAALEGVDDRLVVFVKVAAEVGLVVAAVTDATKDDTEGTPCFVIDADESSGDD